MKLASPPLLRHDSLRSSTAACENALIPRTYAYRIQIIGQLICILTVIALWPHVALPLQLGVWWLGMTVAQMLLTSLVRPSRNHGTHDPLDELSLRHYLSSASAVIGGAAWGSLPLVGPYDAAAPAQMILFMVLGGITLAGAGILSNSRSAYAIFVSATLLPLFILTLVNPPAALPHASVWLTLFVLFAFTLNDILYTSRQASGLSWKGDAELVMTQQTMLDHSSEAIILSRRLRILRSNQRFAAMMHDGHVPLPGSRLKTWFEHRNDWKKHARAASNAFRRGDTYREATRLRRRDGSVFWAEISGEAVTPGSAPPARRVGHLRHHRTHERDRPGSPRRRATARIDRAERRLVLADRCAASTDAGHPPLRRNERPSPAQHRSQLVATPPPRRGRADRTGRRSPALRRPPELPQPDGRGTGRQLCAFMAQHLRNAPGQ